MSPRSALGLLLLAIGCNRTPEPSTLERSAEAAPQPPSLAPATAVPSAPLSAAPVVSGSPLASAPSAPSAGPHSTLKRVIVIAMENHDASEIYQDTANAPYIHSLVQRYAHAENFEDELPLEVPSEAHYVWMEAGTSHFSDATFPDDDPPSPSVSTGSSKHLVTQIKNAKGLSWMSYQEGMNEETGACPIKISGFYAPKHNPFIFFRDISGDPPSKDTAYCAAHHKPYSALEHDLQGELASYVFITPDECHDMHWQRGCPEENPIRTGDRWLQAELPRLIDYADKHDSVIFITFDEGGSTLKLPFLAVGSVVKSGYASSEHYTHSSQLKSVELILGLPLLPTVTNSADLSDLFKPGLFP
ncbi:MAG TPA: alkaline phosphatase family protein [Polyangiaceae bacterium]|nr:alkaline phosphatase family protein [Polyangiaceae bacterium]